MAKKSYMNVYDSMLKGETTGTGKLTPKAIAGKEPMGGKDFKKCTEAYDQIFHAPSKQAPEQKVVLSEENMKEMRLRRMGAAECIKQRLAEGYSVGNIDQLIEDIQDIVKSI